MSRYFLVYGDKIESSQKVLLVVSTDLTLARAKYLANQCLEDMAEEGKISEPYTDYESLDLFELELFAEVADGECVEAYILDTTHRVNLKIKEMLPPAEERKEPIAEYRSTATEDVEKVIEAAKKAKAVKKAKPEKKEKKAKKSKKA